jgi:hypothetical protein
VHFEHENVAVPDKLVEFEYDARESNRRDEIIVARTPAFGS